MINTSKAKKPLTYYDLCAIRCFEENGLSAILIDQNRRGTTYIVARDSKLCSIDIFPRDFDPQNGSMAKAFHHLLRKLEVLFDLEDTISEIEAEERGTRCPPSKLDDWWASFAEQGKPQK